MSDDQRDRPPAGPAWLLRDVTHVPGVLALDAGRLRFVSTGRVVFDAAPAELDLVASRARRGRFAVTVDGERLGLSVVRPPGAVAVPDDLLRAVPGAHDDPAGAGCWEALLAPPARARPARTRAPLAARLRRTLRPAHA